MLAAALGIDVRGTRPTWELPLRRELLRDNAVERDLRVQARRGLGLVAPARMGLARLQVPHEQARPFDVEPVDESAHVEDLAAFERQWNWRVLAELPLDCDEGA